MTQIQAYENMIKEALIEHHRHTLQQHADDMDMLSKELASRAAPIELRVVADILAEGNGCWATCSGCHESNDGAPTGPYSQVMQCTLGVGCSECGGIGAIWDTTDYDEMADAMFGAIQESAPPYLEAQPGALTFLDENTVAAVPHTAPTQKVSRPCRSLRLQQRANEIELLVAQNKMSAAECFTQMRQLIPHPSDAPFTPLESNHQIDPLRGAAEWLVNNCGVTTAIELTKGLRIGYGRASRLIKSVLGEVDETDKMQGSLVTKAFTDCTCPSGNGSLRWPCPVHPPESEQQVQP